MSCCWHAFLFKFEIELEFSLVSFQEFWIYSGTGNFWHLIWTLKFLMILKEVINKRLEICIVWISCARRSSFFFKDDSFDLIEWLIKIFIWIWKLELGNLRTSTCMWIWIFFKIWAKGLDFILIWISTFISYDGSSVTLPCINYYLFLKLNLMI